MMNPWPKFLRTALQVALAFVLGKCCLYAGEAVPPPPPPPTTSSPVVPPVSGVTPDPTPPVVIDPLKVTPEVPAPNNKNFSDKVKPSKLSPADVMTGLDWSATKQSFLEEKGAVVLSGDAWIRYSGVMLQADNIVFYRETREFYAEGHIRLRAGESEMQAASAYIDIDSDSGYLVDAVIKVNAPPDSFGPTSKSKFGIPEDAPTKEEKERAILEARRKVVIGDDNTNVRTKDPYGVYVDTSSDPQARATILMKAEKLIRHSKLHYTTENAFVTNDEMAHPIYGVKAGQLDFYMHEVPDPKRPGKVMLKPEKITVKRAQIQIMGFNLMPFPTVTYDMAKKREYMSIHGGNSTRWGYYALTRFGYGLGGSNDEIQTKPFELRHIYLDVDERQQRGPALGLEMGWQTKGYILPGCGTDRTTYERGSGHVRTYGEYEIQIDTFDDVVRARQNLQRRIQLKENGRQRIRFDANLLFLNRRKIDNAGPPSLALDTYQDDFRGIVDFSHHQPIRRMFGVDNVQLDFVYQRESDRDFRLEFEPINYNKQNQSEALMSARKACDNWSTELLYRTNPQDFDGSPPRSPFDYGTFTGYEPALTYSRVPTSIGGGVFMSGEAQGARMKRYFERAIYDQPNFESQRLYGKVDFARPFKAFCVNFTPRIGGQGMFYDNSRENNVTTVNGRNTVDGDAIGQGALTYGFDMNSRIYGTFCDLENDALGIKGFRHIMEPRLMYRGTSSTIKDPDRILDYDANDNLRHLDTISFSFDQTFQTRRSNKDDDGEHTVTIGGFDTAIDMYPSGNDQKRLLEGDAFALWRTEGFLRVLDVMRLEASVGVNPQNMDVELGSYGITIDPHERWRLKFEERFTYTDSARAIRGSDQYRVRFEYELSDRWRIAYQHINEAKSSILQNKGRQVEKIELTRHYGPFDATIAYSYDRNINESGFYGAVRPTIVARNLIVPENDPLVNSAQISGDFDEPETRNFDPFEILRKSRMGKPRKESVNDVPAPPPAPTSMNGVSGPSSAEVVDLNKEPQFKPKPKPKKAAVDADEWTLPASVSATARE